MADGVTEGGLAVITSACTRKRRANRQTSFGPTCRLVCSPEVGPGATVGILKQGYPLLQYEDATISSRVVNSTRSHHVDGSGAATWPEKTIYSKVSTVGPDPHGKVPDPCMYGPDLRVRSRTSTGVNRTPGRVLDPTVWGSGHSQQDPDIPGQIIPRP
jgi:hypothetical protein